MKNLITKAKNYFNDFRQDESGMELLQLAIVVVITVGLIVVVQTLGKAIYKQIEGAANDVQDMDTNLN